ncbi:LytR/AlgR family response regulator transcription factor [Undibacterium sp. TC4M20W]|uniref:LytR/AlgR family response regulator transcription factor n=1 Tax=Undibacterium sp. TC4M20W TaxID=3413052 RepID=UPI003BF2EC17
MKLLIVEDEPLIAQRLLREARHFFGTKLTQLDHCDDIDEALALLAATDFDLLLLDLNLLGDDGFKILQLKHMASNENAISFQAIIISAHTERAVTAFGFGVIDFVPKPFSQERLFLAFQRFEQSQPSENKSASLVIKKMGNMELLLIADIDFLQADGHYSKIICCDGQQHFHEKSLDNMLQILPDNFVRIHRSYVVNMQHFKRLAINAGGKYSIDTKFSKEIPVSRSMYPKIKELLGAS